MMKSSNRSIRSSFIFAAGLLGLLALTWLIYRPGLHGTFLFDDFVNLNALGASGPVHDWPSFLRYITSGTADPTGRPIALLTFLIDAQNWPADPFSFKRTNVLLHLLNGTLLCWTMLKLGHFGGLGDKHSRRAALLGSAIWLLHPLFTSTTLYIVQREAMLPATFTFCGLLCWCNGRSKLRDGRVGLAWTWMTVGSLLCTLLATLCKANGSLLPLLIVTAECTVLRASAPSSQILRRQRLWLLGLPVLALAIYMVAQIPADVRSAIEHRPWTVGQRLLTEPRVLMSYLRLLWMPRSITQGVFNDQMQVSTGLLTPWTTLPSILCVLALCLVGWHLRKSRPILSFAILFYFAGQAMESTFIPLELFFEHRNYLPAAFMFWPLAAWLTNGQGVVLRRGLAALILIVAAGITWNTTKIWGDLREQALIWGNTNPDSPRAQAFAASVEVAYGHGEEAIARLRAAAIKQPAEIQLTLNLVDAECAAGAVSNDAWQRALYSLRHTINGSDAIITWFTDAVHKARIHACSGLSIQGMQQALQAAQANSLYSQQASRRRDYAHIAGLIALANKQPDIALQDFTQAVLGNPSRGTALAHAAILGSEGYPAYGLRLLSLAQAHAMDAKPVGMPWLNEWILSRQGYWQHETSELRTKLTADAAHRSASPFYPSVN
jgi:hypothetical protein